MNAYEIVMKSREKGRPTAVKYIEKIVDGFIELHKVAHEHADDARRERSARKGQEERPARDGFRFLEIGAEAAVKDDEHEADGTDHVAEVVIGKIAQPRDAEYDAEHHAQPDKEQQGGDFEFVRDAVDEDAEGDDQPDEHQKIDVFHFMPFVAVPARKRLCGNQPRYIFSFPLTTSTLKGKSSYSSPST